MGGCIPSVCIGKPRWANWFPRLRISTAPSRRPRDETDFVYAAITSNFPGGEPQPGAISEIKKYQRFVQEVRFASDFKGPVQFVAGGFYSDFHGRLPFAAYYPPAEVPGLDDTLGGPNNPDYPEFDIRRGLPHRNQGAGGIRRDLLRAHGRAEAHCRPEVVPGENFVGRLRRGLATGGGPAISLLLPKTPRAAPTRNFEVDYRITPDQMVYASVAKGFRPGGLVPIVPPGQAGTATDCVAALKQVDPNITIQDTSSYKSDSLWNYELGAKTAWLDHRVTVNAAASTSSGTTSSSRSCSPADSSTGKRRCCGEQGRRDGDPCAADGTSRTVSRRGLSGRENHRSQRVIAAGGGLAGLSGSGLDRKCRRQRIQRS